ncbi:hypothetical protein ODT55_23735, partial [Escherichia coli]|nr:hypothetical protein [Escherichia coli]
SGGRAADWKTGSFGPYGCPENLSVRFFPNSAGSPSGSMIPQPEVISKKGTRKSQRTKTRSARSRKKMRISALKPENASLRRLLQGKKMKTH